MIRHLTKDSGYCVYDSDISTMLGVSAFLLLLASQVLVVSFSKCFCCGHALQPSGSRACSLILFLITWYVNFDPDLLASRRQLFIELS